MTHWKHHLVTLTCLLTLGATVAQAKPARQTPGGIPACQVTAQYAEALAYNRDQGLSLYDAKRDLFRDATAHHTSSARVTFALNLMEALWQNASMPPARVAAVTLQWCQERGGSIELASALAPATAPRSQPGGLTLCETMAVHAEDLAIQRDRGMSLHDARLSALRLNFVPHEGSHAAEAAMETIVLDMVQGIWRAPTLSPRRIGITTLRWCERFEPASSTEAPGRTPTPAPAPPSTAPRSPTPRR